MSTLSGSVQVDEAMLVRAQRGDEHACKHLVLCYQRSVFCLVGRMLGPAKGLRVVENVAQETFLRVLRTLKTFSPRGPARLSSRILIIASRLAIVELERKRPEPAPFDRRDVPRAIQESLVDLPPAFRAAFLLHEYHGLEYRDIANGLRLDPGAVRSQVLRVKAILRTSMADLKPSNVPMAAP